MIASLNCPRCQKPMKAEVKPGRTAACPACGKAVTMDDITLGPGTIIGNGYRIDCRLNDDSQIQVFLATQESMQRQVAIKILPPDIATNPEKLARFQREVKLAATLEHPHILAAYGAGEDNGMHFLIKQYKPGRPLNVVCQERGVFPEKEALKLLLPVVEALEYAWDSNKVVHRNVKPENILLGDDRQIMLMDLAIAKSMESDATNVTSAGFTVGTPEFMSPEQVRGDSDLDFRTDLYSLGVVLYRMVTGAVPFGDHSAMLVMQKHLREAPVPAQFKNPDVSTACSALLDRMLAKKRDDRFANWAELRTEMKAILRDEKPKAKSDNANRTDRRLRPVGRKQPGAKPDDPVAAGVSRQDVERIAGEMYSRTRFFRKAVLYTIATLIPLIIVGAMLWPRFHQQQRARELEQALQAADAFARENDTSFDTAIANYTRIRDELTPENPLYQRAQAGITQLSVKRVLYLLKERAETQAKAGRLPEAIAIYEDYTGAFAGETAAERKRRAAELKRRTDPPRHRR